MSWPSAVGESWVLAIDQGTSATKCLLASADGGVLRKATAPLDSRFPQPGWVEQDAEHIWLSVVRAGRSCVDGLPPDPMFSALKASWLLADYRDTHRHDPDDRVAFGTVDSFLLARLGVSRPPECTSPRPATRRGPS